MNNLVERTHARAVRDRQTDSLVRGQTWTEEAIRGRREGSY